MHRRFALAILAVPILIASGCSFSARSPSSARLGEPALVQVFAGRPPRFVAERHKLQVLTSESELQKSWESTASFCATIQGEVGSSSITTRTGESVPSGVILLRVVPDELQKLLAHVGNLGKIAQHTTEREDKTTAVVDTEAKLKNLTSFRDSLRTMLAKPSATVSDLVEIQKQLTDTQAELDSETAQRKILANETEKIAVEVSFRVETTNRNSGSLAQIWNALRASGSILADSTASLITTIVAVITLVGPDCACRMDIGKGPAEA